MIHKTSSTSTTTSSRRTTTPWKLSAYPRRKPRRHKRTDNPVQRPRKIQAQQRYDHVVVTSAPWAGKLLTEFVALVHVRKVACAHSSRASAQARSGHPSTHSIAPATAPVRSRVPKGSLQFRPRRRAGEVMQVSTQGRGGLPHGRLSRNIRHHGAGLPAAISTKD